MEPPNTVQGATGDPSFGERVSRIVAVIFCIVSTLSLALPSSAFRHMWGDYGLDVPRVSDLAASRSWDLVHGLLVAGLLASSYVYRAVPTRRRLFIWLAAGIVIVGVVVRIWALMLPGRPPWILAL